MTGQFLLLGGGLLLILAAAEFFTNGIEAFGRHFSFSQAVVGSIFAAVGTALPETILPIVAIFLYGGKSAKEIGVGAILGAPFMLSTLAFLLVGATATAAAYSGRRKFELNVEIGSLRRDMIFFLSMYAPAVFLPMFLGKGALPAIAFLLVAGYVFYAWLTFRGESADLEHSEGMYLWDIAGKMSGKNLPPNPALYAIVVQIASALVVMVWGAHTFVANLEKISLKFGMNPLLFALLLAPVATELPEKFNSVTWTWKGRDTLAMGNLTGAMVFQATFPVTVGLLYTDWNVTGMALFSAVLAIASAAVLLFFASLRKKVSPLLMLFGGFLYLVYAVVLVLG